MWPGNTADAKTLVPVASRLQQRFGVTSVAIVADRGMVSNATISELEKLGWQYILGARMRSSNEVKLQVVGRAGRYREVHPKSPDPKAPSPLKVKEVWVDEHRYVVCLNEDQATKDRLDRDAIVKALTDALKKGDKSLVGNQGFRRYLRTSREPFSIDKEKIKLEERYDGKWVLRTNMSLSAAETALKYKQLWMVEDIFRTMKSVLETRPVYHKCDETILGHVFCSFLSLVVRKELQERLESKGMRLEWADIQRDVDGLQETQFDLDGKSYVLRSQTKGVLGKVAHAVGVALPPDLHEGKIDP
jgi:transposase